MAIINPIGDAAAAQLGLSQTVGPLDDQSDEENRVTASGNTSADGVELSLSAGAQTTLADQPALAVFPNAAQSGPETSNNRNTANPDQTEAADANGAVQAEDADETGSDAVIPVAEDGQSTFTTNGDGSGDASTFDGVQVDVTA